MNDFNDTITAIATPSGEGGIGIVRLSGPKSVPIAAQIFRLEPHRKVTRLPSHTIHYGRIVSGKQMVDEGMLAIMRAPHSYTREDVVEVQAHGGRVPLEKILKLTLEKGARLAKPGEFTRRAFLSGRLDLAQAEAVSDIIRARTEAAYEIALGQLSGGLSAKIKKLRDKLLDLLTRLEANIDFPEETRQGRNRNLRQSLKVVQKEVAALEKEAEKGRIIREGIRVVIIGRPNVGKSSLMNALLKEKRVIVTHLPGTTRDVIEEIVNIHGLTLKIADTAGMGRARNLIEVQGLARSKSYLEKADLVIMVLDGSQSLKRADESIIRELLEQKKRVLVCINKIDLPARLDLAPLKEKFPSRNIVCLSAKRSWGLAKFRRQLVAILGLTRTGGGEAVLVSRIRHQTALRKAGERLTSARAALNKGLSAECLAFDLWLSADFLGEILGLNYREDLLDGIFNEFCIGK